MDSVFVSSVQRGFGDIRAAVARAVETLGMRPLMAERAPALPCGPIPATYTVALDSDATG
jgi:hypothetical protein